MFRSGASRAALRAVFHPQTAPRLAVPRRVWRVTNQKVDQETVQKVGTAKARKGVPRTIRVVVRAVVPLRALKRERSRARTGGRSRLQSLAALVGLAHLSAVQQARLGEGRLSRRRTTCNEPLRRR